MKRPADAPEEPVREGQGTHDSDGESSTNTDLEAKHILEEGQSKWHMEYDMGSSTRVALEVQLQRLIKAITDSFDIVA